MNREGLIQELQQQSELMKKMKSEAKQKFVILKEKLKVSREQTEKVRNEDYEEVLTEINSESSKELSDLIEKCKNLFDENMKYNDQIELMENRVNGTAIENQEFIHSIQEKLNVKSILDISSEINLLVSMPAKIAALREQYAKIQGGNEEETSSQEINEVVESWESLKKSFIKITSSQPENTEVRQLFAAIHNTIHVVLSEIPNEQRLLSHARSVIYQSRAFLTHKSNQKPQIGLKSSFIEPPSVRNGSK